MRLMVAMATGLLMSSAGCSVSFPESIYVASPKAHAQRCVPTEYAVTDLVVAAIAGIAAVGLDVVRRRDGMRDDRTLSPDFTLAGEGLLEALSITFAIGGSASTIYGFVKGSCDGPTLGELTDRLVRASDAARAGDCPTVRALDQQMAHDAPAYHQRVFVIAPAIAACLRSAP